MLTRFYYLFVRGLKQAYRPYLATMPEFAMPVFFFVINSAAFQRVVELPGFTTDSYLQFYAPVALLMAIFFSSGSTGLEMVTDISTGYMDRLFLAPVPRYFIIFSKLCAVGVKAATQTTIMYIMLSLFGANFAGGFYGFIIVLLLAFIFAMAWSGIGLVLAFLTKNPRLVQSSFIIFFPFTFVTTSQLPLNLLTGWYKTAVQLNPVTYILEAIRSVVVQGHIGQTVAIGFITAIIFACVTISAATFAFRRASTT